jgi:aspartyl-tRNA(Asn)/glutamyl-tRNA(Gln) amidotransferase subunit A
MTDLTKLSYSALLKGYRSGQFLPSDVISAYKKRVDDFQHLNAYVSTLFDKAEIQAKEADAYFKTPKTGIAKEVRPLEGFPLAIKDNFATKGEVTSACSAILKNFKPFYESTVTSRLKQAGCIALGKTNMDEFAMGSSTENSIYGPAINPWPAKDTPGKQFVPGGSSGGSAVAVAARLALGALGTDTGGSIRQPAAFNGLVGLKPTYGRCSRYGIIAFASSLDQAGPMTACVEDSLLLFQTMSGMDKKDSTTANLPSFQYEKKKSISEYTFGLPVEFLDICSNDEVRTCWLNTAKVLEGLGATVKEVSLPHLNSALATYYIIAPAEASSNLERYDGIRYGMRIEGQTLEETYVNSRSQGFGEEVKRRIMVGTFVLSSNAYDDFYIQGLKVRNMIFQEMVNAFQEVDLLLTPTTPSPPFGLGDKISNPMEMYYSDMFTVGANLSGMPALTLPVTLTQNGLPLSVQLIANSFQENNLFDAGFALEQEFQFNNTLVQEIK